MWPCLVKRPKRRKLAPVFAHVQIRQESPASAHAIYAGLVCKLQGTLGRPFGYAHQRGTGPMPARWRLARSRDDRVPAEVNLRSKSAGAPSQKVVSSFPPADVMIACIPRPTRTCCREGKRRRRLLASGLETT
jgi:hypothetical protein